MMAIKVGLDIPLIPVDIMMSKSRTLGPDWQFLTLHNVHMPIAFDRSNVESTSPILDFTQIS